MSRFGHLTEAGENEHFSLHSEYLRDPSPRKVTLVLGVYKTEEGTSWPLRSVELAESRLKADANVARHDYLDIAGDSEFLRLARDLAFNFGSDNSGELAYQNREKGRIVSVQTVSGSGANHVGAAFLSRTLRPSRVWLPNPTWPNHQVIWDQVGVKVAMYPYYDSARQCFSFEDCVETLDSRAENGDVILLHACAHNPTGADPTREQWIIIADLCNKKGLVPLFDMAYQGFASGNAASDAWVVQHFLQHEAGNEFVVAQSFSKNFGLYGQRAGSLHVVSSRNALQDTRSIKSNLCYLTTGEISSCPRTGSDIVRTILGDKALRTVWEQDLVVMSSRMKNMRQALYDELVALRTPNSWRHIITQVGMFTYTGLSSKQVVQLRERYHIYILSSGRIALSGLSGKNVGYVAKAINVVVRSIE